MTSPTQQTYDLDEEAARLDAALDEAADAASEADRSSDAFIEAVTRGQDAETYRVGVELLRREYSATSITLRELRAGDFARVDSYTAATAEQSGGNGVGPAKLYTVAAALVDAPFVPDDADFEQRVHAVRQLEQQVLLYLYDRIDDLSTPDVDFIEGFGQRLSARMADVEATGSPEPTSESSSP